MSDTIYRQAAIDAINKAFERVFAWDGTGPLGDKVLENVPSAQPEQKTGHWIRHPEQKNIYGGKCVECSECGEKYMVQYIEDEKFCRNCGARMNGGDDGGET